jgi:hypothetical protein
MNVHTRLTKLLEQTSIIGVDSMFIVYVMFVSVVTVVTVWQNVV